MTKFLLDTLTTAESPEILARNVDLAAVAVAVEVTTNEVAVNFLTANNVWMMMATALVFIMHLGFAGVEAGFTQAKNTVNILFKNIHWIIFFSVNQISNNEHSLKIYMFIKLKKGLI